MPDKQREKPSVFVIATAILILIVFFVLKIKQAADDRRPLLAAVSVDGHQLQVEVADTQAKKEKGLGGRDGLAADAGMYFPFPAAQYWVFWMKDMRFPIDIIWIRDGKIVDVTRNAPVPKGPGPLQTFSPVAPADAVLELDAGSADRFDLKAGDALSLSPRR